MIEGRSGPLSVLPTIANAPVPDAGALASYSEIEVVTLTNDEDFCPADADAIEALGAVSACFCRLARLPRLGSSPRG